MLMRVLLDSNTRLNMPKSAQHDRIIELEQLIILGWKHLLSELDAQNLLALCNGIGKYETRSMVLYLARPHILKQLHEFYPDNIVEAFKSFARNG